MAFTATVKEYGTFGSVVTEKSALFASMSAQGLKGDTGAQGPAGADGATGVVAATSPITYDSMTQTVALDRTAEDAAIESAIANGTIKPNSIRVNAIAFGTTGSPTIQNEAFSSSLLAPYALTSSLGTAAYESLSYWVQSPAVAGTDTQLLSWDAATSRPLWVDNATRSLFLNGTNKTGAVIPKGKAVYVSGATGSHPEITLAQANSEVSAARTIGVTAEQIAVNGTGRVIVAGVVENIDTGSYSAGNTLYLSPTTAGGFVTSLPTQPYHGVVIGYVVRANNSVGVIEVHVQNYQELSELSDVLVNGKADKDILAYDSTAGVWKNKTFSTLDLLTATTAASTYLTQSNASSTYAPKASPTFTGTVTIPAGASISGYLTTATASSTYAPLASPTFTGTVTIPAGASISGYLTSSTAASTYFPIPTGTTAQYLRGNGTTSTFSTDVNSAVSSASTSTAGKVQLATTAEVLAGTDANKAVVSTGVYEARDLNQYGEISLVGPTWLTATSGGAFASNLRIARFVNAFTATGYGTVYIDCVNNARGVSATNAINWAKKVEFTCRVAINPLPSSANTVLRIMLGKSNTSGVAGDLAVRGIGVKLSNGALTAMAHNGTSLSTNATSFTPTAAQAFDLKVSSDGSGTVTVYVNGSSVGTVTGGPTSAGSANQNGYFIEDENTNTVGAGSQLYVTNPKASFAL